MGRQHNSGLGMLSQRVDRAILGRVMSVLMFARLGLMPLSLAAAGVAGGAQLPNLSIDHCVYLRTESVQCEGFGQHIHACFNQVAPDDRIL
jgi:hypothetical protein